MRQILLLVLLFVVAQWFVKAIRRAHGTHAQPGQGAPRGANGGASASGKGALPEPMVRCAECGVHAPRSESVNVGARSFCSAEHARAYDARTTSQDRPAR